MPGVVGYGADAFFPDELRKSGYGFFAHDGFHGRNLFRRAQILEARRHLAKYGHGAAQIARAVLHCHAQLLEKLLRFLGRRGHLVQHGLQRRARLAALDAHVAEQARHGRRLFQRKPGHARHRGDVLHGVAQKLHVRVGRGARQRQHVRNAGHLFSLQAERGKNVRGNVRCTSQVRGRGRRQVQHARKRRDVLFGAESGHGQILLRLPHLHGGELRGRAKLARRGLQRRHLFRRGAGYGSHLGHLILKSGGNAYAGPERSEQDPGGQCHRSHAQRKVAHTTPQRRHAAFNTAHGGPYPGQRAGNHVHQGQRGKYAENFHLTSSARNFRACCRESCGPAW